MEIVLRAVSVAALSSFICLADATALELRARRMDLDGDGHKEAVVQFHNDKAVKAELDRNADGRTDGYLFYRNGHREIGQIDSDYDGIFDTVIDYYFTGVPAAIKYDRNRDGYPDLTRYFKNGFLYKVERDRNYDRIPDVRVLYELGPDYRPKAIDGLQKVQRHYDEDFDGVFDRYLETRRRISVQKADIVAGATVSTEVR
ncbi:MAG: hypothetical protein MOGMAGMI_01595 [Candidatus Omnitrophica bacterium]|nr:hypothetical protein [Candidatus Omnitrophota bacterium]